jgi:uncharacterized protein (TIGR00251 family)
LAAEGIKLATTREGAVRFEVHARPRARTSALAGVREGRLEVRLAALPVDGAANAELLTTLAEALGVAQRDLEIVRGATSRSKHIEVRGLREQEVRERLERGARDHRR